MWQARIGRQLAAQLRTDAEILGLNGRTEIVKAALEMIHKRAAEERMARNVDDFYGEDEPPLPIGIVRADDDTLEPSPAGRVAGTTSDATS